MWVAVGSSYTQHIDAPWVSVLQNVSQCDNSVRGRPKAAGLEAVRLSAGSVTVVEAISWDGTGDSDSPILVEPFTHPLPDRVIVVRTLCLLSWEIPR